MKRYGIEQLATIRRNLFLCSSSLFDLILSFSVAIGRGDRVCRVPLSSSCEQKLWSIKKTDILFCNLVK